jgi:FKBP-type peptidyl-prolyl cis-trans isomerase
MKRLAGSILLVMLALAAGCADPSPDKGKDKGDRKSQGGVEYEDLKVGDGAEAKKGDRVKVFYTGWLAENNKKFDSNVGAPEPIAFTLKSGPGGVITGWVEGVAGMKVGGKRKLYIPSELGYGARGAGRDIPPNADLVFEVELVGIEE